MVNVVAGIDGCKAGWFAVVVAAGRPVAYAVYPSLNAFDAAYPRIRKVWIDIPIGLPSSPYPQRECDAAARRWLGKGMTSRVFSPPCRLALEARDYQQACRVNRQVLNKAVSLQCWHIFAKIKEADMFLREAAQQRAAYIESHPEICFAAFNNQLPVRCRKQQSAGLEQRLAILARHWPAAGTIYHTVCEAFPRSALRRDDIVDAMVLALAAWTTHRALRTLPCRPPVDEIGLPMRIAYPG